MRILLRLPNWIGDGVMLTPAFEILKNYYKDARFILVGVQVVCDLYKRDHRVEKIFIDETKKAKNRFLATYKLARKIGQCDLALTFTNHFYSALLLYFTHSTKRVGFAGFLRSFLLTNAFKPQKTNHQVLSYIQFTKALGINEEAGRLKLIYKPIDLKSNAKVVGIGTGAAYGSAKAWIVDYFVEVIVFLLKQKYKVFLFGSNAESLLNLKIKNLVEKQYLEYPKHLLCDLSNQTNIPQLVDYIAHLDLFIGNDSGPTHIAAALDTPLIAIFGPTYPKYSLPWQTKKSIVINKHVPCSPCQKRECPLGHHQCMREIKPQEVIEAIKKQLGE